MGVSQCLLPKVLTWTVSAAVMLGQPARLTAAMIALERREQGRLKSEKIEGEVIRVHTKGPTGRYTTDI